MKDKRRSFYTVKRSNPLTWLAVLAALAGAAGYIANVTCEKGAGVSGAWIWLRVVLPVAAALYFAWQVPVHGHDRIFRLALPFWMLEIGYVFATFQLGLAWYWVVLLIAVDLGLAVLMHRVLSGTLPFDWLMIPIAGVYMAGILWFNRPCLRCAFVFTDWLVFLPDLVMMLGYVLVCFAMKRVNDDAYHPMWGDRPDGRKVRSLSPISVVGGYVMPERNQANVFFHDTLEITELERYIRKKRETMPDFGMTEVLLAAYVRTASKYPGLNRFISGEKIYSRGDDLQFCMTIKKELTQEAPDTVIKLHLQPGDDVATVYEKFHDAVADVRKSSELDSSLDGAAAFVGAIPGVVLKFVVWLLKLLDYFGLLPKAILELSPFHCSIFFTSMGSLGIGAVYHHLYNFGNLPIFMAFGRKYRKNEIGDDGTVISKKYMDYTFNVDERTVDGFYYAASIKYMHKLLLHPDRLDAPEMEINRDIP